MRISNWSSGVCSSDRFDFTCISYWTSSTLASSAFFMSSRRHLVKETRVVATVAAGDDCTMAAKSNVVISILRLPIPHDYILRRLDDGYRKWERFSAQDRRRDRKSTRLNSSH